MTGKANDFWAACGLLPAADRLILSIFRSFLLIPGSLLLFRIKHALQPFQSIAVILLWSLCAIQAQAQPLLLRGVVQGDDRQPLPFVNVIVTGTVHGTTTDIEGRFQIRVWPGQSLEFRYVGYQSLVWNPTGEHKPVMIVLQEHRTELQSVTVHAGENPALVLIRKVLAQRSRHDPMAQPSWSYHAYNKLACAIELTGSSKELGKDSVSMRRFTERNNAFVSESYTYKTYHKPQEKEVVLANRLSGIKDPFFAFLATDIQPFGFYSTYITLPGGEYVNPVSQPGLAGYDYEIMDTIPHLTDSTFIVRFEPLPGTTFKSLKGQLSISTDGYAIENVLASGADEHQLMDTHIQQQYARHQGRWFPVMLNSEILFSSYHVKGIRPHYFSRSYLTDIRYDSVPVPDRLDDITVSFDPLANKRPESFWHNLRLDSLNKKELNTYHLYDSLEPQLRGMNSFIKVMEGFMVGHLKAGVVDLPVEHFLKFNAYEGLRAGFGVVTNDRISRRFRLGGYVGYGFKDRALKYGGSVGLRFSERRDATLTLSYQQDLLEPGNPSFIKSGIPVNNESLRAWMAARMDSLQAYAASFRIRPHRHWQVNTYLQETHRKPNYPYHLRYPLEQGPFTSRQEFVATEVGLQVRWAKGEQHLQIGNYKVPTNVAYPQVQLSVVRGVAGLFRGALEYTRVETAINSRHRLGRAGTLSWQLSAGLLQSPTTMPYSFLFNGRGSLYPGAFQQGFILNNYFQTMGLYEFLSDQYAYLFLQHHLGRITSNQWPYFRPELSLLHHMGIGSLKNSAAHLAIDFKTMDRTYVESGLLLTNILRVNYLNLFYYGLGGGVFYRYGPYALPTVSQNLAWKLVVTIGL